MVCELSRHFEGHPERGLRAFGRVFAGWGLSQAFYRQDIHTQLGARSLEDFLVTDFDTPSLKRNGNDLLAQIWTWQHADIGDNEVFRGDRVKALRSIRARTLVMPSETDLYFTVADAKAEAAHMPVRFLRRGVIAPAIRCAIPPISNSSSTRRASCSNLDGADGCSITKSARLHKKPALE